MMPSGLFCILILGIAAPIFACNKIDLESLMLLSFTASPPLNWSTSTDCCSWEGISCDQSGRVNHLKLPFRGLKGKINHFLGNLTHLSYPQLSHNLLYGRLPNRLFTSLTRLDTIDLSFNSFSGELPSFLTSPSSVQVVDFSSNQLNGTIDPLLFHDISNLVSFNVSNNSFTRAIPESLCSKSNHIKLLDFSHNEFSYQIPQGLGGCYELEVFRAGFNDLTGNLPYDIYNLSALTEISLPANSLTGPISDEVVQFSNLTVLDLFSNELTGNIPPDIGKLSKLEQLQLYANNLSGPLPPTLINCSNLVKLTLRVNLLEGDVTARNFSKLHKLRVIDLGDNHLSGKLPGSLFKCKSLVAVRLSNNNFTGEVPASVSQLQSLLYISLSKNRLRNITGAIRILEGCKNLNVLLLSWNFYGETLPDEPGIVKDGFKHVRVLALCACGFTGRFPSWIQKFKELEVADLSINQLTGPIPGWLGTLPIFYLDLANNFFSGIHIREIYTLQALTSTAKKVEPFSLELPISVNPHNDSPVLQYTSFSFLPPTINLSNNSLNGNIPEEIGQLKLLHVLNLSMNNFTGRIPDQISALTNLEKLDLSDNQLSGEIPSSLKGLNFLSGFSVANNKLTGKIPQGNQLQTFPASSYIGNPGLCGLPLQDSCDLGSEDGESNQKYTEEDSEPEIQWLYVIVGLGYVTGLSIVLVTLLCHTSWRNAYFNFLINLKDNCYMQIIIYARRLQMNSRVTHVITETLETNEDFLMCKIQLC